MADLIMGLDRLDETVRNFQLPEENKQPDHFTTELGLIIDAEAPTQIAPQRRNRRKILVSNTGTDSILIGNSSRTCLAGDTLLAGSQLGIKSRQAVWGYIPAPTPEALTTVDVLETLYGEPPVRTGLSYGD